MTLFVFNMFSKTLITQTEPVIRLYLTMQTMGSSSLSLGTSIQVISMAAGSPGEQGVKRSSTITWLLLRDGPQTCRQSLNY